MTKGFYIYVIILLLLVYSCKDRSQIIAGDNAMDKLNYLSAIESYSKYIEKDTLDGVVYGKRGICYIKLGKYGNALLDLDRAILLDPTNQEYFKLRGDINLLMRSYSSAINDYDIYAKLGGNNNLISCSKGFAYTELEDYYNAIRYCKQCVSIKDNIDSYGLAYFALARTYYEKKDLDSANYYSNFAVRFGYDSTDVIIDLIRKKYEIFKLEEQSRDKIQMLYEEEMKKDG